jgi:hypothetical protein
MPDYLAEVSKPVRSVAKIALTASTIIERWRYDVVDTVIS